MFEEKRKMLLVDDELDTREMYAALFRNHDFEVIEAGDGVEGLDIANSVEGIDIIFTGIEMPRMDCFMLVEQLRQNPMTEKIPVVINSHYGREDDLKRAEELTVKDIIVRGTIAPHELVRRILMVLGEGRSFKLKIDPYELDAQRLVQEQGMPEELKCLNCGNFIAVEVISGNKGNYSAKFKCLNCGREY